jgi:ubiquinone/menaquinone biosynthesis C-methylase UbiE
MIRVAGDLNREAVLDHRLDLVQADAHDLPFANETYTCASLHGILGFLREPVTALSEIRRVLRVSGRLLCLGADPELRGTPACPEPIASGLSFYDDDGLLGLGQAAGFNKVKVVHRNLEQYAREVGIPEGPPQPFCRSGCTFSLSDKILISH